MKKNRMMRIASLLLVCVLLTTCVVSGTFAKYVTSDSGSDSARVAKWGVAVLVSGNLFGEKYESDVIKETSNAAEVEVSATGTNIVAPGTKNTTGVTISVSGTPEVSNKVTLSTTAGNNKDIYLKAASYATMVEAKGVTADNFADGIYYTLSSSTYTKATAFAASTTYYEAHDAVTVAADYYPVVWTVTGNGAGTYTKVADIVTALQGAFNSSATADNKPKDAIDKSATITWAWAFSTNDGADTILGNIIAADTDAVPVKTTDSGSTYTTLTATTDYCTDVAFNYTVTVAQTDTLAVATS